MEFDNGLLVRLSERLRPLQLNLTARDIAGRSSGEPSTVEAARAGARDYSGPLTPALSDLQELLADLEEPGVLERHQGRDEGGKSMAGLRQYLANPDVLCREGGPEGAVLFNPGTGGMILLNSTGLVIWQALDRPRTQAELVAHLMECCDGVPADQVGSDVDEFLQALLPGFLCEVPDGHGK